MRGVERLERVVGIIFIAVEKMFSVVDDLPAILHEMADGVADHGEVFLGRGAQNLGDVEEPGFAKDGDDGRAGIEEHLDLGVVGHGGVGAACGAEGGELGVGQFQAAGFVKKLLVARVGAGPAALDVVHAKGVELFDEAQLGGHAEGNALALRAVAQGGVIGEDEVGGVGRGFGRGRHGREEDRMEDGKWKMEKLAEMRKCGQA